MPPRDVHRNRNPATPRILEFAYRANPHNAGTGVTRQQRRFFVLAGSRQYRIARTERQYSTGMYDGFLTLFFVTLCGYAIRSL